jgi:alkanesulfonate monooxygenase SsuD/methylene tetrahydromethanopterin reductase-like flavin-dependent oxidoreductase (luciferase family)
VIPEIDDPPEVWVCGSASAADIAARCGARYCSTLFHGRIGPPEHVERYRDTFEPSDHAEVPHAAVAIAGTCADTEAEALAMRAAFRNQRFVASLVGTPEQCRLGIDLFCEEYGVNEVIILDIAPDLDRRMRSATLFAEVMELER